jgi:trimeric autotransporter adhesin
MHHLSRRITYANVMSTLAVFLVLGGATAFAATKIGSAQIKANAIVTGKIKKEAVTEAKLKAGAVGTAKLAGGAVTAAKLGASAVGAGQLANGSVDGSKLAAGAVGPGNLADGSVGGSKLAAGAVTPDKLSQAYLPADTVGVPLAGVSVESGGTLRTFFNRAGGEPTVTRLGNGEYEVVFPGLEHKLSVSKSISAATLSDASAGGEIAHTTVFGNPHVLTFNSSGTKADRPFELVVFTAE